MEITILIKGDEIVSIGKIDASSKIGQKSRLLVKVNYEENGYLAVFVRFVTAFKTASFLHHICYSTRERGT
ncbi:MAG: hypothetical protein WCF03_10720 [Nitrososphaeraceae archaeon]